ncbi:MAG: ABC transporter substrate-binding protein [Candidatus Uhrbacteria bacterium]
MKLNSPIQKLRQGLGIVKSIFVRGPKNLTTAQVLKVSRTHSFPSFRQWRELPRVMSKTERLISVVALALLAAAIIFVASWYVVTHREEVPAVGGEYTEGLVGEPQLINPLYAVASDVDNDIASLVYSGLFRYDPVSGLVPDLAASYEISEDQTTYTIKIRDDAYWHDGDPVLSDDVVFTIQSTQNSDYKSPYAVTFRNIGVAEIDDKTVQFILPEPFAPFLSTLTMGILPQHVWSQIAPKRATLTELNLTPIGSGPYKFDKFTKDKLGNIGSYTLVRNDRFHGEAPKIENIVFKFYADANAAVDALANHNVEGLAFVPSDLVAEVEKVRGVEILRPSIPQITVLFFNQEANELLLDEDVRQALTQATDKGSLIKEVLGGFGTPIYGPIIEGMIGYHDSIETLPFNLEVAANLLDEAGWKLEEGAALRTKGTGDDAEDLIFTLTVVDQPEYIQAAEVLRNQWSTVGVGLEIRVVAAVDLQASVLSGRNFEIFLTGELMGIDPDPVPFWHSSQINDPGLNLAQYTNRNVDTLLEEARVTTDPEERAQKYIEFQDLLVEDLPAIFLYQPTYRYAVADKIKNIELERITTPADRFSRVSDWYIKTKMKLAWPWQLGRDETVTEPVEEATDDLILEGPNRPEPAEEVTAEEEPSEQG